MKWHPASQLDQTKFAPAEVFSAGLVQHHIANTAYPIHHTSTMRPYKVARAEVQALARQAWDGIDELGLYVHIPFCQQRCKYCEYAVLDPVRNDLDQALYFDLLLREFELNAQALDTGRKTLIGFDIGGGTPALAQAEQLERVVSAALQHFQLPSELVISIETTPKIAAADLGKIQALYQMGIGRISMGVQTINPKLLEQVGRIHGVAATNQQAAANIRTAGFERFNVDLMYGFAGQSVASWEATLQHAISLGPEYITLYRMRYKGTRLAAQAGQVELAEVIRLYKLAAQILKAAGYVGTPGKNTFSRVPGDVGTSEYLTERVIRGTPYLGLGLAAQSLSHQTLAYNAGAASKTLRPYQKQIEAGQLPIQDLYHLSLPAAMAKMISVSFYFGEIHRPSFADKFGLELEVAFPAEIDFLLERGLMHWTPNTFRLTSDGVEQVNGVIALFYAGAVKSHLIELSRSDV